MSRRPPHGPRVLALLALLAALVAAGCGGAQQTATGGSGPDPATVAPADAALYGQAIVRPSGAMKDGVRAAARKVLHVQDPGAELQRLLDGAQSDGIRFSRDVEPWLGQRVGGFLLTPSTDARHPDGAAALAIGDSDAFAAALPRLRQGQHSAGSYRGVAYDQDGRDKALFGGRVADFYVIGTLRGVRAAIDASKGANLAGASRYADAVGQVPDGALGFLYADPRAIAGALAHASPTARAALARYAQADPVVASLTATADEISLQATVDRRLAGSLDGGGSDAAVSVGQLPGDSWLALATPPLGPAIGQALVGAGVHDTAAAQVRAKLGLDLDSDLLDPLGGLGLFVRGTSLLDMGGGVLLQLTSAAAAQRLLTEVETVLRAGAHIPTRPLSVSGGRGFDVLVPQSPQPIVVLAKGDKLAAGYGSSSAEDLISPQQRFDESGAGKAAIATLGEGYTPSLVLLVPQLATLLRSLDELQVAHLSSVLPYVNAYRSVAVGTKSDGDRTTLRAVAALR